MSDRAKLPTDAKSRKDAPIARGVLDYFPNALAEVAALSRIGNEQHNPGQPMHWAKEKSTDHADCIIRHLIDRGTIDTDGVRHATKVAWRALALLQTELESLELLPAVEVREGALGLVPRRHKPGAIVPTDKYGNMLPCGHNDPVFVDLAGKRRCGGCGDMIGDKPT